ncbi:MAG: hypothetical protein PHU23_06635 [Dehalococcoidales bacterium]|nr:hypothetical protein [Dehalococcoidales bacterium]
MAESNIHIRLVTALVSWIAAKYFRGERGSLLIDSPESPAIAKPPRICDYVPDVIGQGLPSGAVVIGEAKTAGDLENLHTCEQLEIFLRYCAARPGSVFVFAVPWHMNRFARALLKNIIRRCGYEGVSTEVLENLEG